LHTIFWVESPCELFIKFNWNTWGPDLPEMDITWEYCIRGWWWWNRRRSLPIWNLRSQFSDYLRNNLLENLFIHNLGLQFLDIIESILPSPLFPSNHNLIISIPKCYWRMETNTFNVLIYFLFDVFIIWGIWKNWIHCTCEHQIMPNKYP
jgi:hypothetical protein